MPQAVIPILIAVLIWWASTGILILLVGRGQRTRQVVAGGLTVVMMLSTWLIINLKNETSIPAAYAGFAVGITLWAWQESLFLFGFVTGPRRDVSPPGLVGWRRFTVSAQTVMHHELLIAAHAVLIVGLSVSAGNQMAAATFVLLWGMRLSTKMLIFMGAPNASDTFLPEHLKYLSTYFNRTRVTPYYPIFIALTGGVTAALFYFGFSSPQGTFEATCYLLLGTLSFLAVFEHLALILPMQDERLWTWALRKRPDANPKAQTEQNRS